MSEQGREGIVTASEMTTHDFVAVGLGPFNLGLACLTDPIAELDGVFLERKSTFTWHPGMLLDGATLQTPFLADLVTLADPTSKYSFLNYLKQAGRLYSFYIRENFFPLRSEYDRYCRWAAEQLGTVEFDREVTSVEYDEVDGTYRVHAVDTGSGKTLTYRCRRLVLGTGTPPQVPAACRDLASHGPANTVVHSSNYLAAKADLQATRDITVLGSGQSAAEIYYELLAESERNDYTLTWITRSPRFFPLEYTKLTLELTSPEYCDYFHALPRPTRDELVAGQRGLYKGIDSELIDSIFDLLYERSVDGPVRTRLLTNTELTGAEYRPGDGDYLLGLHQHEQDRVFTLRTEALVLATGYRYRAPEFLDPIADRIEWDTAGHFVTGRDYTIDTAGGSIFVQNAELHTHGFVTPDLGMGAHRNSRIIRAMLGREYYPVERSIAFQEFSAPTADPDDARGTRREVDAA